MAEQVEHDKAAKHSEASGKSSTAVGSAHGGRSEGGGRPVVLFTAFEPSGDNLAAPVIKQLLAMRPDVRVYAWGGPKMAAAGAKIVVQSAADGAMGLDAISRVFKVKKEISKIGKWMKNVRPAIHVPVDSPAANFPICKLTRANGAFVVHLAAPQLWAWGGWRIGKLRALTDIVLCLLPFEEQWFKDRQVPARFIGHPAVNRQLDLETIRINMRNLPRGAPKLAIFPGSRSHEVRANLGLFLRAYEELQGRHSGMAGVIVASSIENAKIVRKAIKVFPHGLHMVTGQVDETIAWCDLALAVSGTITLDLTLQRKPMVVVYKKGLISVLLSKVILRTPFRVLPNIIAEREIVPEFVPHAGGAGVIVKHAAKYIQDSKNAAVQQEELNRVCLRFANQKPAETAAKAIIALIEKRAQMARAGGA